MGLLIDPTADLYRHTRDGRRVYGMPVFLGRGPKWYLVSDAAAAQLQRRLRVHSALAFCIVVVMGPLFSLYGRQWLWLLMVPLAYAIGLNYWIRRTLPRVVVSSSDLVPIDRRARDLADAQRVGEPVLWILFVAALAMASLSVVVLVESGVWWVWPGLLMFGAGTVMMARGIRMVRRARRRTVRPQAR